MSRMPRWLQYLIVIAAVAGAFYWVKHTPPQQRREIAEKVKEFFVGPSGDEPRASERASRQELEAEVMGRDERHR